MNGLGKHLLVELMGCDSKILNDRKVIRNFLVKAAQAAGATPVKDIFHPFSPVGISGVVVIAESHLSIHTWPEYGYAAVDVFTCGDKISPEIAANFLAEKLQAQHVSMMEVTRGIINISGHRIPHKIGESYDGKPQGFGMAL
ncbi:MAG TPA: S-adenosylmethionine decarboxylase proenzyme [Syntrophaceae bacterium]|nr:S-adenosylmethionine decarboxylase proenzyme [Syntrophaceae bacterium]